MALTAITYTLGRSLYVSMTNRANALTLIASRGPGFVMPPSSGFSLLPDGFEPSPDEVVEAVRAACDALDEPPSALVFAGAGEPLLKLRGLLEVADQLKNEHEHMRINTNGLVASAEAADTAARLKAAGVSAACVALATADADQYLALMEPEKLRFSPVHSLQLGHAEVVGFVSACLDAGMDVECTAVAAPGVDIDAAAGLATKLGATFRARSWHP